MDIQVLIICNPENWSYVCVTFQTGRHNDSINIRIVYMATTQDFLEF